MAKRKRLILPFDPAVPDAVSGKSPFPEAGVVMDSAGTEPVSAMGAKPVSPLGIAPTFSAPIARVSAEAAATAALQDLADEVTRAREDGRLVQALPLSAIDEGWIKRDRIGLDEEELTALIESLRMHGQRNAIEVVLSRKGSDPAQMRYGLISGWRRLTALRRLHEETGEARFSTVLAIERRPEGAGDAYVAMVEENEIRLGLSYYERARIAALAVRAGVFATPREALQRLYANVSRAKRSKIGSFLRVFDSLDPVLRFPAAIPERLGLAIAAGLEADADFAQRLTRQLEADGPETAEAEMALIWQVLKGRGKEASALSAPDGEDQVGNVRLRRTGRGISLEGPGVDDRLAADLRAWLIARGG